MSTYLSNRLFYITLILLASFITFSAISFAQETEGTDEPEASRQIAPAQVRESVLDRVSENREAVKERNANRKTLLMERVEEITDDVKRAALERILNSFETINENKTTRWANALDTLSSILERIKTKLDALEEEGVDTASAVAQVTEAESLLADATEAVEAQAEKIYDVEFTDETTLREVVSPVAQQFKQDLRTTFSAVTATRDAVREAARALAGVNSDSTVNEEEQNTVTP